MVSDALVPLLLGPRGLGRLLWQLQHVAKDCSLGQARQEVEKAVLLLDREDELIPTHVPPLPTAHFLLPPPSPAHPRTGPSMFQLLVQS